MGLAWYMSYKQPPPPTNARTPPAGGARAGPPLPRRLALGRWLVDESESAGCATRAQRARFLPRARTLAAACQLLPPLTLSLSAPLRSRRGACSSVRAPLHAHGTKVRASTGAVLAAEGILGLRLLHARPAAAYPAACPSAGNGSQRRQDGRSTAASLGRRLTCGRRAHVPGLSPQRTLLAASPPPVLPLWHPSAPCCESPWC